MKNETIPKKKLVIATRGSKLALWQANFVADKLRSQGAEPKLNIISTKGDRVQDRFLHEIGGKGLFVRELEQALQNGEADLAVHSLKDLPVRLPSGFTLACILPRHSPRDVLIPHPKTQRSWNQAKLSAEQLRSMGKLTIATASLRRECILAKECPEISTVPIRGNVDTRIAKLADSSWDGIILAEASLDRLELTGVQRRVLTSDWFTPCAGQGALAIETLIDHPIHQWLGQFSCSQTTQAVTIERNILARLGGDCTMPFAAFAQYEEKKWHVDAQVLNQQGLRARCQLTFDSGVTVDAIATDVMKKLREAGGKAIFESIQLAIPEEWK